MSSFQKDTSVVPQTTQTVLSQDVLSQGALSQGSLSQGSLSQGSLSQGAIAQSSATVATGLSALKRYEGDISDYLPYSSPQIDPTQYPTDESIAAVRAYIKATWQTLRRGHDHILTAAKDCKVEHESGQSWPV